MTSGEKARETNKLKFGKEFYREIGRIGGRTKSNAIHLRGFGTNRELAVQMGKLKKGKKHVKAL